MRVIILKDITKEGFYKMLEIFMSVSNYLCIFIITFYVYSSFNSLKKTTLKRKKHQFFLQKVLIYLFHLLTFSIIYINGPSSSIIVFYGITLLYLMLTFELSVLIYPKLNRILLNNMCFLITIGIIILSRISIEKAVRQFIFLVISTILFLIIPYFIGKVRSLRKYYYLYGIIGFFSIVFVFLFGNATFGAKIAIDLGFITVQPSEFVKITFILFLSGILYNGLSMKNVLFSAIIGGLHVILLVLSKDLGTALIFFVTYVFVIYITTGKKFYLFSGIFFATLASIGGYILFDHVKVRVSAWMDPWSIIDKGGYQVTQSLFGIGTGGWFGMGLYKGDPNLIPVVEQDFVFSAISEELGAFFALLLIFLYFNIFITIVKISMKCKDSFYKTVSIGLGIILSIQTILTIGGAIKMIPSTGVTLPLISYGGSSLLSTLIIFGILQSIYMSESKNTSSLKKEDSNNGK